MVDPPVETYVRSLLPESQGLIAALERDAHAQGVPIIHPEIAQLMRTLIHVHRPQRILEIGTAIGYSTTVMAEAMEQAHTLDLDSAMRSERRLHIDTIEIREDMFQKAQETFARNLTSVHIQSHLGDASEILEALSGAYDMVFMDAAKGQYGVFFEKCYPLLKPGGVLLSDNVLFKGMVASRTYLIRRKITIVKRLRRYLTLLSNHPGLETSVLSVGDGFAISYKKRNIQEDGVEKN